jgi:hypothetical protein
MNWGGWTVHYCKHIVGHLEPMSMIKMKWTWHSVQRCAGRTKRFCPMAESNPDPLDHRSSVQPTDLQLCSRNVVACRAPWQCNSINSRYLSRSLREVCVGSWRLYTWMPSRHRAPSCELPVNRAQCRREPSRPREMDYSSIYTGVRLSTTL